MAGPSPAEAMPEENGHEASARVGGPSPAMTGQARDNVFTFDAGFAD